jgi:hypothetical protein
MLLKSFFRVWRHVFSPVFRDRARYRGYRRLSIKSLHESTRSWFSVPLSAMSFKAKAKQFGKNIIGYPEHDPPVISSTDYFRNLPVYTDPKHGVRYLLFSFAAAMLLLYLTMIRSSITFPVCSRYSDGSLVTVSKLRLAILPHVLRCHYRFRMVHW